MNMPYEQSNDEDIDPVELGRIPIRNVWLLFLYASELSQFHDQFRAQIDQASDFRSLISRLLCHIVEKRLRRGLSIQHRHYSDILRRVRGRIDILETHTRMLLQQGRVACRYDQLSLDIPRNRLARVALTYLSSEMGEALVAQGQPERPGGRRLREELEYLSRKCGFLARSLGRVGVSDARPSNAELAVEQIAGHEREDRLMYSLSKLALDYALPTEQPGIRPTPRTIREGIRYHDLFEMAVGNFYRVELPRDQWKVSTKKKLFWNETDKLRGISNHLPGMEADIVLQNMKSDRIIIIDTKFKNIYKKDNRYPELHRFHSNDIYQLYSYLRSQECDRSEVSKKSEGILLYPSISQDVDAEAKFHGHRIRFVTVNLTKQGYDIVNQLRSLADVESR